MHALRCFATLAGLLVLTACHASQPLKAPAPVANLSPEELARKYFIAELGRVFQRDGNAANTEKLSGSFNLTFRLDAANHLLACSAGPSPAGEKLGYLYNQQLQQQLASLCWTVVMPELPASMANDSGRTDLVAPLIFHPLGEGSAEWEERQRRRRTTYAQQGFFWQHALATETLDSIGIARFRVLANGQGQVQGCEAVIDPHPLRRRAFVQDNALVERLNQRCKQLDLRAMPGFAVDNQGIARVFVAVEYTPWKNGVPKWESAPVKTP